jgi:CRISPR-associated protein Cst1
MITYTGHPFVDTGFAVITAFVRKRRFADLTDDDFQQIADYIEANYVRQPLRSFLTVAFTSNAWFAQSAFNPDRPNLSPEKQAEAREKRQYWAGSAFAPVATGCCRARNLPFHRVAGGRS